MSTSQFSQFALDHRILDALVELGYEKPTPVQEQGIPILLSGGDLLAQAQTGTGKTAVFALPILSHIDVTLKMPQALILAPTRELAIQVAEAFQSYAKYLKGFLVTPIYGGQDYNTQFRLLKRGPQVIVGTPGRLMDHLRRKSLPFDAIKTVVLDEADEMLKMGFVDDVEWILNQITSAHQTALFSATIPQSIQNISHRYLKDAKKIYIKSHKNAVETIEQCYVIVSRNQKLDLLTRLLEVESSQAMIVFARTKNESAELAEKLQARGYKAAALNGDMSQALREKTIERLRAGALDILVATDVAARGIDVERVTHVINYDIPFDVDAYVHRIGRTGRAGREGKAILFVTPRETRLFNDIMHHVQKEIKRIEPPSLKDIRNKRAAQFSEKIIRVLKAQADVCKPFLDNVRELTKNHHCSAEQVAAAMMYLDQEKNTLLDVSDEMLTVEVDKNPVFRKPRNRNRFSNRREDGRRFDHHKRSDHDFKSKDRGFKKKDAGSEKRDKRDRNDNKNRSPHARSDSEASKGARRRPKARDPRTR